VVKINNVVRKNLFIVRAVIGSVLLLALMMSASAQNGDRSATDGMTPLGISPGSPAGSYALSGFDNINLYNGNLNFRLPLLQVGGRGAAQMGMLLAINNKNWRVKYTYREFPNNTIESWAPEENRWVGSDAGYGPGYLKGRQTGAGIWTCASFNNLYSYTMTRLTFVAPDGTEYELRDKATNGQPLDVNVCQDDGAFRGTEFVTADGSSMTFISDTSIRDHNRPTNFGRTISPSGYLMMRDGTRYRIDSGRVSWVRDRNGNKLTYTYNGSGQLITITDSLNRQVTIAYRVSDPVFGLCDQISFKGVGGAQRMIRVARYNRLDTAFRPGAGYFRKTYQQLFPELNGSSTTEFNPERVTSVWLPDATSPSSRRYSFYYNEYGELERAELPTGSAIEYRMTAGSGVISLCSDCSKEIYRRVTERHVYADGASLEGKTVYTVSQSGVHDAKPWSSTVTIDQQNGGGALLARSKHYFDGSGLASLFSAYQFNLYSAWNEGRENKTEAFDSNGTTMLRRIRETWQQKQAIWWWSAWATQQHLDVADEPPNDPRMTQSVTTLSDTNQVTKQLFAYDEYNNKTDVWEYDFGSGAAPAFPLRHTRTSYLTTNQVNGINYATNNNIHLRGLPAQTQVYSVNPATGGETLAAQADYEYDRYDFSAFHAPLESRFNISGLDSGFSTSYTPRGNVTAVSRWLNTTGGSVTNYQQYDVAGSIIKSFDARGNVNTVDYSDRFGWPDGNARLNSAPSELGGLSSYAYPSAVTNALGHTTYTQQDYYTGKPVDGEDANGIVSSAYYNDTLDRPTQLFQAIGTAIQARTLYSYDDFNRIVTTNRDLNAYTDGLLQSQVLYDKLGRTVETRGYEPGGGYLKSTTSYDALGRVWRVTNPNRTTSEETYGWTDTSYDGLSRVKTVQSFDRFGASMGTVTTTYSGNTTKITDQAQKQRRSTTDAIGRLKSVEELYETGTLYATTTYSHNALDKLISVQQGSQSRSFIYDSLSRMTDATNPESGTVHYEYDPNGNLSWKRDARNVRTDFTYDAINRISTRTYSDTTPDVTYSYDSGSVFYSKGRLTQVSAVAPDFSFSSSYSYDEYDALGRVKRSTQMTDGQAYLFDYRYDLAGNTTWEKYPSNREVTTAYDSAGRISSITGVKSSLSTTYASSFSYSAQGGLSSVRLGNNLWEQVKFNSRLQPYDMRLGTSNGDFSKLRLEFGYGTTTNNGNVLSQTITAAGATISQSYTYDHLNRLWTATESGAWSQSYQYDQWGNRAVTAGYVPNTTLTPQALVSFNTSNNRLVASLYDLAGNQTQDAEGKQFGYDAENRQVSFNNGAARYYYDGDGRRVKKIDAAGTTLFVYNAAGQLIAEYATGGATGSGTSYLMQDHLGSTRVVTDATGAVKARRDYLPFGEEIAANMGVRSSVAGYSTSDGTRQKFTGQERDTESGLDYFRARYFSSAQGRFTSPDPLHSSASLIDPQSWNRYIYVGNRPLIYTDPSGLVWVRHRDENNNIDDYKWIPGKELSAADANNGWELVPGGGVGLTYTSIHGDLILLGHNGKWANLGYVGPEIDFQNGLGKDFAGWYVKFAATNVVGSLTGIGLASLFKAVLAARGVAVGTEAAGGGLSIASSAGGKIAPMQVFRIIQKGEKLDEVINEAKALTWTTQNEHAVVTLASGERALVSGGSGGIKFAEGQVQRIFGHIHPTNAPPSAADAAAIKSLGQSKQYVFHGGERTVVRPK
jgi:RHS repeat-associated protein